MGRTESVFPGITKAEEVADAAVSFADVPLEEGDTAELAAETALAKAPATEELAAAEPEVGAAPATSVAAVAAEMGASPTMGPSSVTPSPEDDEVVPVVADVVVLEVVGLVPELVSDEVEVPAPVSVPLSDEVVDEPSEEVVPVLEVPPLFEVEVEVEVVDVVSCPLTLIWQF